MQTSALQNHKPSLFMTPFMAPLGSQGSPYALPLLKVHVSSAASQVPGLFHMALRQETHSPGTRESSWVSQLLALWGAGVPARLG